MNVEFFVISLLNGVSYGLLLFMLSSGLTLIFSMMGVLNFAHTSFYMLGAYFAYTLSGVVGFWPALFLRRCWCSRWARPSSATACAACTSSATCPSCW
jgi:branched-subunit amino acid ABC-type transport system permease component